jgi:hypothetical protein
MLDCVHMRQRWKLALLGFLLALAATLPPAHATTATAATALSAPESNDSLFSLSSVDRGVNQVLAEAANLPSNAEGLWQANDLTAGADDSNAEMSDAVRHRNMTRFVLVILALGTVIRFVTSRAYLDFIADVLDPKAF